MAGQSPSQRTLQTEVRELTGRKKFDGKRASSWAPQTLQQFNVPHSGSDPTVLALVEVWTRWMGGHFNRKEWQNLLEAARVEQEKERGEHSSRADSAGSTADPNGVTATFRPRPESESSVDRGSGGLPPLSPNFTGHDRVLSALLDSLVPPEQPAVAGNARVSVVTGMPGGGKTEVALQAAHAGASRGWFPGGVLFADLNGYDVEPRRRRSAAQVVDEFLHQLGHDAKASDRDRDRSGEFRSVLAQLATTGRRVLLVLDNASSRTDLIPLLPSDGVTPVLITSRETLTLGRVHEVDPLTTGSGVDLLRRTLQTVRGDGDARVDQEPTAAAEIVILCGGLPLALTIAGAFIAGSPVFSVGHYARLLRNEHSRLSRLRRGDIAVEAAFDLSYQYLPDREREVFRLLSANPGPGFSSEAAAYLTCLDTEINNDHVDDTEILLHNLAIAHLIEPGVHPGRWRMHDLMFLFSMRHGEESEQATADQREKAVQHVLQYYAHWLFQASKLLDNPLSSKGEEPPFSNVGYALGWCNFERANLFAAVQSAVTCAVDLSVMLCLGLNIYTARQHLFEDMRIAAQTTLAAVRATGNSRFEEEILCRLGHALAGLHRYDEALATYQEALDTASRSGKTTTDIMIGMGCVLAEIGRFDEAMEIFTGIMEQPSEETPESIAVAHTNFAGILFHMGRHAEAQIVATKARDIQHRRRDPFGEGMALNILGAAQAEQGDLLKAAASLSRSWKLLHDCGDRANEVKSANSLGCVYHKLGNHHKAIEILTTARDICRTTGDLPTLAILLRNLTDVWYTTGQHFEALEAGEEARELLSALGDDHSVAQVEIKMTISRWFSGDRDGALSLATSTLESFRVLENREGEAALACITSAFLRDADRWEESLAVARRAETLARDVGNLKLVATAQQMAGEALWAGGQLDAAVDPLRQSVIGFQELDSKEKALASRHSLANVLFLAGRFEEFHEVWPPKQVTDDDTPS